MEQQEARQEERGEAPPPTQREPVSEQAPVKPKRRRLSSPEDNAVRVRKAIAAVRLRRAAAHDTYQAKCVALADEERRLLASINDDEREILFRLDPKLRPPPPPPGMASGPY